MGYAKQPGSLLELPTPGYDVAESCRREAPIPEVTGPCKMVEAYCREKGVSDGNIGMFCIPQFIIRQRLDFFSHHDPTLVTQCANEKYNALAPALRTFSSNCAPFIDGCRNASDDGNNWWIYEGCYKKVLMGYAKQPGTELVLPKPSFDVIEN